MDSNIDRKSYDNEFCHTISPKSLPTCKVYLRKLNLKHMSSDADDLDKNLVTTIKRSDRISSMKSLNITNIDKKSCDSSDINIKMDGDLRKNKKSKLLNEENVNKDSSQSSYGDYLSTLEDSDLDIEKLKQIFTYNCSFSLSTLEKIKDLDIIIDWDLPETHKVYFNLKIDRYKCYNDLLKKGVIINNKPYSNYEEQIILSNWKKFSKTYGIYDPHLLISSFVPKRILNYEKRKKILQYLGNGLENRTLISIHCKVNELLNMDVLMNGFLTIRDDQVINAINRLPPSEFNSIYLTKSKLMQYTLLRSDSNLLRRKKTLLKNKEHYRYERIKWSWEKIKKLVKLVMKESDTHNFKDIYLDDEIWDKIANRLKCGSGIQLKMFWHFRLIAQVASDRPVFRNKLRCQMIEWVYAWTKYHPNQSNDWETISWAEMARDLKLPACFLYRKFRKMALTYVPLKKVHSVKETIDHLHEHFLPILKSCTLKDYYLKRYKLTQKNDLIEISGI